MPGLSNPRSNYGLHSVSPYGRTDALPYGILKVLTGSSLTLSGTNVELRGGSQKFPWAVETGELKAEVDLKFKEFPDFVTTLFMGATPVTSAASATGSVSALTNKLGTSAQKATTGIASIGITATTGAALLKFGKYVVKVISATTVHVYAYTDLDAARGGALTYQDDSLVVTATALSITTGAVTVIPNTGLEFTGGSGTIGMTVGDTATFQVLPPSTKSMAVTVGGAASTFPEFGMIAMAQKTGDLRMCELDIFRCKGSGLPRGFTPNTWAEADVKLGVFYDATKDGVFSERYIEEAS